jgi:tetratricopeptide (TPR) repeat protein
MKGHPFLALAALVLCASAPAPAQEQKSAAIPAVTALPGKPPSGLDLIDALSRAGHKREALAEADRIVTNGAASAALRTQRGFLRRELNDLPGAIEDFDAALAGDGLATDQRRNVEAGLAEARAVENHNDTQAALSRAQAAIARRDFDSAADEAQRVLKRDPSSEAAMLLRLQALIAAERKARALADADAFVQRMPQSAALRAQRGYLRRGREDPQGAVEDFTAALANEGLTTEQQHNVKAALAEAQAAVKQAAADAKAALETEKRALAVAQPNAKSSPSAAATMPRPAQSADADTLIAQGHAPGWAYVERGLKRRKANDLKGAVQDFAAALKSKDLDAKSIRDVRYAQAEAIATLAERQGKPLVAEASYRELLQSEPRQADAWYKLGYLLMKQKRRQQGADALTRGLEIKPVATAYLDAANAYVLSNAPLASREYRRGLDRWYAGDSSTKGRSPADLERVKNEVVQADASIQTSAAVGGMTGRPASAGGNNSAGGAETRVRFDGRYLPAVAGLEAFAHGLTDKDANGERETDLGAGLRYRPIPDLNFYVGGLGDHFFQPRSENEFVAIWGLGLGADAYPYTRGWKPYWDFGTFGSWRTADARVLEDGHANLGALHELRTPLRTAVGPTLLAVAGYDSKAGTPWATGVGPSLLAYIWLGGDKYRSYDSVVTLQVGYIFNVGPDQRQRGWRGQIAVTF